MKNEDLVNQSIAECAKALKFPLASLPLYINSDRRGPLAHVSTDGIWINEKVIDKDPTNVKVYLAHEIFHWVVNNNTLLSKYTPPVVNIITDLKINELLLKLFDYNVQKVKFKGLLNPAWFGLTLDEIGERLLNAKQPKDACSAEGMPHQAIGECAAALRKRYAKHLEVNEPIFTLLPEDEAVFAKALSVLGRHKVHFTTYPIDNFEFLKALWYCFWHKNPVAAKPSGPLTIEQSLLFSLRFPSRSPAIGLETDAIWLAHEVMQALDADEHFIKRAVGSTERRLTQVNYELRDPYRVLRGKKIFLKPKRKAKLQKLKSKLEKQLTRWKTAIPLQKLLVEQPVQLQSMKRSATLNTIATKTHVSLAPVRINETVSRIRLLTNNAQKLAKDALEEAKKFQRDLGTAFDASQLPPEPEGKKKKQGSADNTGASNGSGRGIGASTGSRGDRTGDGQRQHTRVDLLDSICSSRARILTNILNYMHEVETLIKQLKPTARKAGTDGADVMFEYGNDLDRILPEEVSLLANPLTQMDFLVKYSTHQLLMKSPIERKRQAVSLCIDGSGSMQGSDYQMAAGFCLAVIKHLINDRRGVSLLVFDHEVTREVIANTDERIDLAHILGILTAPSFGGTNFDTVLLRSQAIRDECKWKSQAIFLVTDGGDSCTEVDRIKRNKKKHDRIIGVLTNKKASGSGLAEVADKITYAKNRLTCDLVDAAHSLF